MLNESQQRGPGWQHYGSSSWKTNYKHAIVGNGKGALDEPQPKSMLNHRRVCDFTIVGAWRDARVLVGKLCSIVRIRKEISQLHEHDESETVRIRKARPSDETYKLTLTSSLDSTWSLLLQDQQDQCLTQWIGCTAETTATFPRFQGLERMEEELEGS